MVGQKEEVRKPGPEKRRGTDTGSLGLGGRGGKHSLWGVRQERRVRETTLRAQETLWWDLKSRCCNVSVGLSTKTLTYPGAITPSPTTLASRRPCKCFCLCIFCFVLFLAWLSLFCIPGT